MHRILVVEDEPQVRRFLGLALQKRGYEVLAAETASQALRGCAEFDIDLLITDVGLPDLSGPQLAQRCQDIVHHALPVVFISGYGDVDLERRGVHDEDVVLTKPFGVWELQQAVASALSDRG